ncbi:hypothetical protein [Deinococcus pimensis]|uniref:hypothetical protein n=1 Tax=Deinococcus pimensis TaxID=309888 RepID=UPI0004824156|nr:hypothetical protein [Deinococcus pimensis]
MRGQEALHFPRPVVDLRVGLTDEHVWTAVSAAGGHRRAVHVDFMVSSGEVDEVGDLPGGSVEPLMRSGECTCGVG